MRHTLPAITKIDSAAVSFDTLEPGRGGTDLVVAQAKLQGHGIGREVRQAEIRVQFLIETRSAQCAGDQVQTAAHPPAIHVGPVSETSTNFGLVKVIGVKVMNCIQAAVQGKTVAAR